MKINTNALTFIAVGVMMEVLLSNAAGIRNTQAKDRRFGRHLQDENDDENSCLSIMDYLCSTDDYSTLCDVLQEYELADAFIDGKWTLFAPNNEAFEGMPSSVTDDYATIMKFHVLEGEIMTFDDLICTGTVETMNGQESRTKCAMKGAEKYQTGRGNSALGTMPKIVKADISVCNGILHGVDNLLLPNLNIAGNNDDDHDSDHNIDVVGTCARHNNSEPELIDVKGNQLFRRTLIAREFLQDDDEGRIIKVTFKLCKDESELQFPDTGYGPSYIDVGVGDYFRLAPTREWWNYTGVPGGPRYSGFKGVTGTRAYSPVGPMQNNTVELMVKVTTSKYEFDKDGNPRTDCVAGESCQLGMSRLLYELPLGEDVLFTERPEQSLYVGDDCKVGYFANNINVKRGPLDGPYTINFIGQGIAPTEINVVALSELKSPQTKKVTILLADSYWSNVEWGWTKTPSNDLVRELFQQQGKYGAKLEFKYAISREDRPESTLGQGRIDIDRIKKAFNVTEKPTGTQDPNVKWLVVGNSGFKTTIYPMLLELGYDLRLAPDDEYGIYYDGPNSLYTKLLEDDDPYLRDKSPLYKYYEELEG